MRPVGLVVVWTCISAAALACLPGNTAAQEATPSPDSISASRSEVANRREPPARHARTQDSAGQQNTPPGGDSSSPDATPFIELQQARFEYEYLGRALALLEEQRALVQTFADTAEERFKAARGSQIDVLSAQLELLKLAAKQTQFEERAELEKFRVNRLLSKPCETAIDTSPTEEEPAELTHSLEEIQKMALGSSRTIPESNASAKSRSNGNKNQNRIPSTLLAQLEQEYLEASTSWRLIQLYRTNIIPLAGIALESAFGSYQAGGTDFKQLMDTALTLFDAQLESCRYTASYQSAIAQLEHLAGVKLTQSKEVASASR